MKRCPECRRDYTDETLIYCLDDGSPLVEGPGTAEAADTAIFTSADRFAESSTRVLTGGRQCIGQKVRGNQAKDLDEGFAMGDHGHTCYWF
jgi:hypothetical protein